jgi:hypothetical protein
LNEKALLGISRKSVYSDFANSEVGSLFFSVKNRSILVRIQELKFGIEFFVNWSSQESANLDFEMCLKLF